MQDNITCQNENDEESNVQNKQIAFSIAIQFLF
jgi:hypothetical protein